MFTPAGRGRKRGEGRWVGEVGQDTMNALARESEEEKTHAHGEALKTGFLIGGSCTCIGLETRGREALGPCVQELRDLERRKQPITRRGS